MWNCLPYSGGIVDQPVGLLEHMTIAMNIYAVFKTAQKKDTWAKWATENPDAVELYEWVLRIRDADK